MLSPTCAMVWPPMFQAQVTEAVRSFLCGGGSADHSRYDTLCGSDLFHMFTNTEECCAVCLFEKKTMLDCGMDPRAAVEVLLCQQYVRGGECVLETSCRARPIGPQTQRAHTCLLVRGGERVVFGREVKNNCLMPRPRRALRGGSDGSVCSPFS